LNKMVKVMVDSRVEDALLAEAELRPFCGARRSSNYLFRYSGVLRVRVRARDI
jgi:hypothetical protein